jgi:ataxia telangiectasia mutated family protein
MYDIAESFHRNVRTAAQPPQKRRKLQNPLEDLLSDLASSSVMPNQRVIRLQALLFLIERHWMKLYKSQREQIGGVLLEVVSRVASGEEAWAFLCFAAIAASEPEVGNPSAAKVEWTAFWMHALRKSTSVSLQIARAAGHVIHCLLYWRRIDDQRALNDVESFIKGFKSDPGDAGEPGSYGTGAGCSRNDLSGTGVTPLWPSESICAMLVSFIRIASSDVRLSRLRLEESILSWLEGCLTRSLTISGTSSTDLRGVFRGGIASRYISRPDVHTNPQDLLALLQAICGLPKRPHIHCSTPLPDHELVRTIVHYHEQDILRTFILVAKLPSIISDNTAANTTSADSIQMEGGASTLASPTGAIAGGFTPAVREAKVSRTLELVLDVLWNELKLGDLEDEVNSGDPSTVPKPALDKVLIVLDIVVLAFSFEGSLEINGTRPDGTVIEAASRLLDSMIPWKQIGRDTTGWWWGDTQWGKVLGGLEPLVWSDFEEELPTPGPDTVILRPNSLSGIRCGIWRSLEHSPYLEQRRRRRHLSNMLLRSIWQHIHVS